MPENKLTPTIFCIILLLITLAQITAEIYIPALPAVGIALASTNTLIKFTVTAFMLGFSISHFFYGPLSDRIGRRKPILVGILLSIIGGIICSFAPNIQILIVGRFIQGLGVGGCTSVGRVITSDLSSGKQLAKFGSYLGMITAFVIASAPIVGGYLQHHLQNWRLIFMALLIYTCLLGIFIWWRLPETNLRLNSNATQLPVMLNNYVILLRSKTFIGYAFCSSLAYAGIIAYLTATPFLLQTIVGLNPVEFGWLALSVALSISIAGFINTRYVLIKGIPNMIAHGAILMLSGGMLMLILALLGFMNTVVIMLPVICFCMGAGLCFTNAFAGALSLYPAISGSAGALFGSVQILGAFLSSAVIALAHERNQIPLAIMFIVLGIFSFISLKRLAAAKIEIPTLDEDMA